MNSKNKIIKFLTNGDYRFDILSNYGLYDSLPDDEFIRRKFHALMGYTPDLNNPKTFNEKIQWLKLHDRRPEYTVMVDKYAVKEYVASIIGEEYIIPTLGLWDDFDRINFDDLPQQFVLKCTHDSGGIVICKDKEKFDKDAARKKINRFMKRDFYKYGREWPYKDVPHRIIAEQYMEDHATGELRDYKIFNFDGVAKVLFVASERQNKNVDTKFDFFDMDWRHLPLTNGHPNAEVPPRKPETFDTMIRLAHDLSKDIPLVRTDFYEINGKTYFGELTFSHWSGFVPFNPPSWDEEFGKWINLPEQFGGGTA